MELDEWIKKDKCERTCDECKLNAAAIVATVGLMGAIINLVKVIW